VDEFGAEQNPTVRLIDRTDPYRNNFLAVNQVTMRDGDEKCRFDVVLFPRVLRARPPPEAQHLTAELTGRFRAERKPLSAISLHAETSSLTAICNDYGPDEMFARQLFAHGRPGDVLLTLSTSGSSANVVAAAKAGKEIGMATWAMTGPSPNPLAALCDDAIPVDADSVSVVQEMHLVLVHSLCAALESAMGVGR
ncbi:D-sedoheptulose-7-phosphate isomerase, partial [Nocardia cyriacigeorgica]|uniref:D-sedoheptulose-7-phosphate isomerase n=1 Tax=Nocardia cyriacigeorgica TaxID=135487 RepID=UPI002455E5CB